MPEHLDTDFLCKLAGNQKNDTEVIEIQQPTKKQHRDKYMNDLSQSLSAVILYYYRTGTHIETLCAFHWFTNNRNLNPW